MWAMTEYFKKDRRALWISTVYDIFCPVLDRINPQVPWIQHIEAVFKCLLYEISEALWREDQSAPSVFKLRSQLWQRYLPKIWRLYCYLPENWRQKYKGINGCPRWPVSANYFAFFAKKKARLRKWKWVCTVCRSNTANLPLLTFCLCLNLEKLIIHI